MNRDLSTKEYPSKAYFEEIGAWPKGSSNKIIRTYVTGFVLSLVLTFTAYYLVVLNHSIPETIVISAIVVLAGLQFIVQMTCFLHLGKEASSRDKLFVLCVTGVIVIILVSGSLWIMSSLNSRMMPSATQMEYYMNGQQGI
jgi:cytochrome o ubiquinol oxidase operon protein cyoD